MGSVVSYRCPACSFATENLQVGWGKAGRAKFWGGLALCVACKELMIVNLAESRVERREQKCSRCNGPLKLLEGTADTIACPRCGKSLRHTLVGSWA